LFACNCRRISFYQLFGYNRNCGPAALAGAAKPESAKQKVISICYRSIFRAFFPEARTAKQRICCRKCARESRFSPIEALCADDRPPEELAGEAAGRRTRIVQSIRVRKF
jgi:hypothetical protein